MSTASDWYARKLGGGDRNPNPPPATVPPYLPPAGYQVPQGYRLVPDPAPVPQAYAQQPYGQPQGYQGQPDNYQQTAAYLAGMGVHIGGGGGHHDPWAPVPPSPVNTAMIPRGSVNPANFLQMAAFWRGGQGNAQAEHCPRCNGVMYRRFEGRKEAAPLCTGCGWNGLFDQGEHAHVAA